jgi:uncharacterized membrane protein YcfT
MTHNTTQSHDILWINTLKAACIFLVVLYHVTLPGFTNTIPFLTSGKDIANLWTLLNKYLEPYRMPAFFFISGFLSYKSVKFRSWTELSTGRLGNLLYLYILWNIIQWALVYLITTEISGERISTNTNAIYSSSFMNLVTLSFLGMSSSWYLYALFLYLLLEKIFRNHTHLLFCIAIVILYIATLKIIPYWGPQSLLKYFIFFHVGLNHSSLIISLSNIRINNFKSWILLVSGAMIHRMLGINNNCFESLLGIIISIYIFRIINSNFKLQRINEFGRLTLPIYVIHRILIELLGMLTIQYVFSNQLFNSPYFSIIWSSGYPIVMTLLCSVISLALWKVINNGKGQWLFGIKKLNNQN